MSRTESKIKIIIIEGPSGVGKDAIIAQLIAQHPNVFQKITSYTTRAMRVGEIDGIAYCFTDRQTFLSKLKSGDIFEHTERHGEYRGMSKALIDNIINNGKIALKDADIIGVNALKKVYPNKVLSIFVTAKREFIEQRLINRGDAQPDREKRLADYDNAHKFSHEYDFIVENNGTLDEAVAKVYSLIKRHL